MIRSLSADKAPLFSNKQKTIGVLVGSQSSHFQEGVVHGAHTMCEKLGYNVITFAGGPLNPPKNGPQNRSRLFDLVDPDLFDGLIITLSSLTRYSTEDETKDFLNRFAEIPIINVNGYHKDLINLTTDYAIGLQALIHHYIQDHNYKKIALFRGPKNHNTSNNRHATYKEALEKHGLIYDEDLVVYGDLDASTANNFVIELLDRRGLECDAIITMNDSTTLEVISLLKTRGLNVPDDIAISGSMNISDGQLSKPQLTTIQEPIEALGNKAVLILKDLFMGHKVKRIYDIPTSLIIRESCGCTIKEIELTPLVLTPQAHGVDDTKDHPITIHLKNYCLNNDQMHLLSSEMGDIKTLINDYEEAFTCQDPQIFSRKLEAYVNMSLSSLTISIWIDLIKRMQSNTTQYAFQFGSNKNTLQLQNTLNHLLEFLHTKETIFQSQETKFYIEYLRNVSQRLNPSTDLVSIHKYVIRLLELNNCFITVYGQDAPLQEKVTCLHALRDKEFVDLSDEQKVFSAASLLPPSLKPFTDRYNFIVFPLYYKVNFLGYLLIDYKERNRTSHENIQALISASLQNELQHLALKSAKERFRDIAHSTSDWLWEINSEGIFTYSSTSVYSVLGLTDMAIIGRSMKDILNLDAFSVFSKIDQQEPLLNLHCSAEHVNGDTRYLHISGIPHHQGNLFIGYRGVIKDITNQTLQEKRIKHLAYYDLLTALPNRALFQEQLDQLIEESQTHQTPLATIFFDIDRFKNINDSMGHSAGDIILKKVSNILRESIEPKHMLARIGGDEFTIIVPNAVSRTDIITLVETIIRNLQPPLKLEGQSLYVTMSFGIAMYPNDGLDANTLLKKADNAMYKAKNQGRNQYVFYDQLNDHHHMTRLQQEELLHDAIKQNLFFLEYQPHVLTTSGEICGFEALVRINHPIWGTIYPNDFITLAEELDLIRKIDEWVLDQVCQCITSWKKSGLALLPISVNMSATQLANHDLVPLYLDILNRHQLDPKFIQLEITENALIENETTALTILTQLKAHGFSIALDDFGTGHSSLTCVNLYPIDILKIDRSFIIHSVSHKKSQAIIATVMHMAKNLNLRVIAEGVETEEQYKLIRDLQCDLIQGYYFSKPKAMTAFEEIRLSNKPFPITH